VHSTYGLSICLSVFVRLKNHIIYDIIYNITLYMYILIDILICTQHTYAYFCVFVDRGAYT
jgi:hypothetical protein